MQRKWLGWLALVIAVLLVSLAGSLAVEAAKPEQWLILMYDEKGDPWLIEHNKSFTARFAENGPVYACLQTKIYNTPEKEIYLSRYWVDTRDYSYRLEWTMTLRDGQIVDEGSGTPDFKAPLPEGSNASNFFKRAVSYMRAGQF